MLKRAAERAEPWDVVVIGGGATGVGCALDAASRGLSVLLLEQADFGKGTSGRSTKLIHGGIRYLAQGNISLVREALAERSTLRNLAPAFVKEQSFIVPCYSHFQKFYYGAGLMIYDLLAGHGTFRRSELLTAEATVKSLPGLVRKGLKGSVRYSDGRFDDTRFLIALAAKASDLGAVLINYAKVESVDTKTERDFATVVFRDLETGVLHQTTALAVISAAGIFSGILTDSEGERERKKLALSQGIHLVLDGKFLDGREALVVPKTSDGRVLFAIPWHGKLLVGTTDTAVADAVLEPRALESEIDFVLGTCAGYFSRKPGREDIRSVFAGIRPLIASNEGAKTSRLPREHLVEVTRDRFVTVTGGKWTTYRRMAEESVDAAALEAGITGSRSWTDEISIKDERAKGAARLMSEDETLARKPSTGFKYTLADVVYAIRFEMARTIDDVLSRRTRILYTDAAEAVRLAPEIAGLLSEELAWSDEKRDGELKVFLDLAKNYLPELSG